MAPWKPPPHQHDRALPRRWSRCCASGAVSAYWGRRIADPHPDVPRAVRHPPTHERAFGDLRIDPESREVTLAGAPVDLTRTEFDILDVLSAKRDAFSAEPKYVLTVRGVGFRMGPG